MSESWRLVRGAELLGEIVIESTDFPWTFGRFVPQPAFDEFEPLFDEELALVESGLDGDWDRIYDRITEALSLVSPKGPVAEFLLHIRDGEAWFRWSDEPFEY